MKGRTPARKSGIAGPKKRRPIMESLFPEKVRAKRFFAKKSPVKLANGRAHQLIRELPSFSRFLDGKEYGRRIEQARRIEVLYNTERLNKAEARAFLDETAALMDNLRFLKSKK